MQLIVEQYGGTVAKLYGLLTLFFAASYSTWIVMLFLHPINRPVLWTILLLGLQNVFNLYALVGSEISLQEPNWRRLRFNRLFFCR